MKMPSEMTKKELKKEYIAICEMIDIFECYGIRDLRWRDMLEKEIMKRGMEIRTRVEVV